MLEISKMLTLSSAHVSAHTLYKLAVEPHTDEMGLSVYEKAEYGYWIYVSDEFSDTVNKDTVPADLYACMELAHKHGCTWLCLDCDGEEISDLPTYWG